MISTKITRLAACLLLLSLTACTLPTTPVPPTSIPTLPAPTLTLTLPPAPPATATLLPPTAVPPTAPPPAPTITPGAVVAAKPPIEFQFPGSASRLVSPVQVSGSSDSTFEQALVIQISGEDGKVLTTQPVQIQAPMGERGLFSAKVPFTVTREQPGRVSVYETSARDGGLVRLVSVDVTLLTGAPAQIIPAALPANPLIISIPKALSVISGGKLSLSGSSGPVFENQLSVVLCGEGGSGAAERLCGSANNVLARGTAYVNAPDFGKPGPFTGELSYKVTARVQARLMVYVTSPRDGGILTLVSIPITLNP